MRSKVSLKSVLVAMAATLVAVASFAQPPAINPSIQNALYLVETEQTQKAIKELDQAIAANPTDATLPFYAGYVQLKVNNKAKASEYFEKGAKVNEKEPLNYVGKAQVNLMDGKPAEAKLNFDKALSLGKKNITVLKAVGEAYLVDSKYLVESINILNKAKGINENDFEVHILLGDAFLQQNTNAGQAVSSYERAAALKPNARALYKVGLVFDRAKNYENSVENYVKAIATDPNYTPAYKDLGEVYYKTKEFQKAVQAYENYLKLTEKPEAVQFQYAFYLFAAKDYLKANEVFKKLTNQPDVKPVTLRFAAKSQYEAGNFGDAVAIYDKYFEKAKKEELEANDYEYYGRSFLKLKKDSLAIIGFKKSLALSPENTDILQIVADSYLRTKKFPEAIDSYKELMAKRKKPMSLDYFSIGRAYYLNSQLIEADSAFTKLIELQPTMTVGYEWQTKVKSNQDPTSEQGLAKPYYEKIIEIAGVNPEKNKKILVEAYGYLGAYYYNVKHDIAATKPYYEKILQLTPDDASAKENIEILKKLEKK
jgi:tetratricopeptide (TPR) repeat protein